MEDKCLIRQMTFLLNVSPLLRRYILERPKIEKMYKIILVPKNVPPEAVEFIFILY